MGDKQEGIQLVVSVVLTNQPPAAHKHAKTHSCRENCTPNYATPKFKQKLTPLQIEADSFQIDAQAASWHSVPFFPYTRLNTQTHG